MIDLLYRFWYWITGFSLKLVALVLVVPVGAFAFLFLVKSEGAGQIKINSDLNDRVVSGNVKDLDWDSKEIVIWQVEGAAVLNPLVDRSEEFSPGYSIKVVSFESEKELEASLAGLKSVKNGPDLVIGGLGLNKFIADGVLVKYSEDVFKAELDRDVYDKVVFESSSVSNDFVAIPLSVNVSMLFYNKDIFGSEAPKSVEEMAEWYIKNYKKYRGICINDVPRDGQALLSNLGGALWVDRIGKPEKIGERIVEGDFFSNFARLSSVGDGKFVNGLGEGDCIEDFAEGRYGFLLAESSRVVGFDKISYGVAAFPDGGGEGSPWVSSTLIYNGKSSFIKSRVEAVSNILRFLNSREGQVELGSKSGHIPARSDAVELLEGGLGVAGKIISNGLYEREDIISGLGWDDTVKKVFEIGHKSKVDDRAVELEKLRVKFREKVTSYLKSSKK